MNDGYDRVLIDSVLHEKMKSLAKEENVSIIDEYREALKEHIRIKTSEKVARDSGLEVYINERITNMDKHLASMMARTGMDASMILMANVMLLENLFKMERKELMGKLRKDGAKYFTAAVKEDKSKINVKE